MQAGKAHDNVEAHVLDADIAAFEKLREELERAHLDEFALFFEGKFVGVYPGRGRILNRARKKRAL
jgi:hypothetical protein